MPKTPSTMLPLGTVAPNFALPDTKGNMVNLSEYTDSKGYLVLFICNHCPFVIHVAEELKRLTDEYSQKGISVFAINANDVENHPDDSPEKMVEEKEKRGYSFPYLFDESQKVAKAYRAACTPDIFLFDGEKKLVYRGQLDSSRPSTGVEVTGEDLRNALESLLNGQGVVEVQKPAIGCNIKWKAGNEPDYFGIQ